MQPVSQFLEFRGLNFHIQEWGDSSKPLLVLLHGWMDCGGSFQRVVEPLLDDFFVVTPDLRGFGKSDHAPGGYWFADYYADLDCILNHYSPSQSVNLVGHSMGGNVAMLYAGIQPHRIRRVMSLEALGLPASQASDAPEKYRRWLRETLSDEQPRVYPNFDAFCFSIHKVNPSLSPEAVMELAQHWGEQVDEQGAYRLRHDHRHKYTNPMRYHYDDTKEIWKEITAKVGLVMGGRSRHYEMYSQGGRIDEVRELLGIGDDAYFVIEEAAHMLHLEQADQTANCIRTFFTSSF